MHKQTVLFGIFLMLLGLGFSAARAGDKSVLTWDDCVKEAAKNHPDIISASEKVKQSQAEKTIAQSSLFPQISAGASTGKSGREDTSQDSESYSYSITGSQTLFDGLKTFNNIKAAEETLSASEYSAMEVSSDVRLQLRIAFVGVLKAQEFLALTEKIALRRKQNLDLVRLRYEAGREHKGALLTAEADLAQAEFDAAQAKRDLGLAQRELIKELGRKHFEPVTATGDFSIIDPKVSPDFEVLAENAPEMKRFIAQSNAAKLGVKSARADLFPELFLEGSAGRNSSDWPPEDDQWSIGLNLSVPLFEGGKKKAQINQAEAQLNQAKADEQSTRNKIVYTLAEMWKTFKDAAEAVSVQKKYLDAAEERATIANAQYSTGLTSFDDWIIIENNLVSSRKSYLNAKANAQIKEAYWLQAKGETLDHE
jgi:TolC family type I secretion outer membrane protein